MGQVTIIGIYLAKRSFQLHGAQANGSVALRRKLSRGKLLDFLASQPRSVVAMEACASAHHWGRENGKSLPQFGLHRAHIDGQVAFAGPPRLRKVEKIAYEALAPVEREQIRGLVGELDAQQCVALHGAGTPASACGGVRQTSVDDASHLLERHPGHAGRLVTRQDHARQVCVQYLSSVVEGIKGRMGGIASRACAVRKFRTIRQPRTWAPTAARASSAALRTRSRSIVPLSRIGASDLQVLAMSSSRSCFGQASPKSSPIV